MSDVLAWIDVETTGLNPFVGDHLLEVACILTDTQLNVLSEPYHATVGYLKEEADRMFAVSDPYVQDMHQASGLWDRLSDVSKTKSFMQIEDELLDHIKEFAPESRQARLAGNSVTLDLNFLKCYLGYVYDHLHYRSVDVTAIEYDLVNQGLIVQRPKNPQHEALADIQDSIEQLRDIHRQLRAGRAQTTRHTNPPRSV